MYEKPISGSYTWVLTESLDISRKPSVWAGLSHLLFPAAKYCLSFFTPDISLENKTERDTIFPLGDAEASQEYSKAESMLVQHPG